MAKDSEITIISVGPGAADMITVRAVNAIKEQDVIIASKEAAETFAHGLNVYIPEKLMTGTLEYISACAYKKIGVLATGDAGFFSIAGSIVKNFGNVKVIAGVSSVCCGFALLKTDWSSYRFLSVHGRELDLPELHGNTVILCDGRNTPDRVLEADPRIKYKYKIAILKDISLPSEAVYTEPQGSYDSTRLILVLTEKKK